MNKVLPALFVILCSTLLSGCYQSAAPLIAPDAADFPFGARLRYAAFEWNADKGMWDDSEPGALAREGDHYLQTPDGSAPSDATPFRLKSIEGGYYIGQEEADSRYVYDLLKIDGDTIYEYAITCDDAAKPLVAMGLVDKIEMEGVVGNICTVSNFDRLAQVFRGIVMNRQPKAKFVIAR